MNSHSYLKYRPGCFIVGSSNFLWHFAFLMAWSHLRLLESLLAQLAEHSLFDLKEEVPSVRRSDATSSPANSSNCWKELYATLEVLGGHVGEVPRRVEGHLSTKLMKRVTYLLGSWSLLLWVKIVSHVSGCGGPWSPSIQSNFFCIRNIKLFSYLSKSDRKNT